MYSGRKNPNDYFNGLVVCVLMSTCFKNINIRLFPESSRSLLHWKVLYRKIDDDNEDATLTPLFAPSAGNLYFVKIMQIVYGNFY